MCKTLNILVACEESQAVTKELRALGHNAFSCDIVECTGGHPEWHIKGDATRVINGKCEFVTQDGTPHQMSTRWDLLLAFPPCTHLAVSGARHFDKKRADGRQREGILFFKTMLDADCDRIAVENPVNIIGGEYIKRYFPEFSDLPNCNQKIQPYQFGDKSRKTTCLWLKNLNPLVPTDIVEPELVSYVCKNGKIATFSKDYGSGGGNNGARRSKTYKGIAKAMATQFTNQILEEKQ